MKRPDYNGPCPVERVIGIFGGKWKPSILYYLEKNGPLRFGELRKVIPQVTQRMLTQQLRELERDGLVKRTDYREMPPKVDYRLTRLGATFRPIGHQLEEWGENHMGKVDKSRKSYDKTT
ncbi:MAG: helix-turn-helix domain-containing protein [Verrucomicrobiota bacterium]